jgi:hypothetical protein
MVTGESFGALVWRAEKLSFFIFALYNIPLVYYTPRIRRYIIQRFLFSFVTFPYNIPLVYYTLSTTFCAYLWYIIRESHTISVYYTGDFYSSDARIIYR